MSEMVERVANAMARGEGDWLMDHWRDRASLAIQAMQEPTKTMCDAGYNVSTAGYAEEAKIVWQAMIDAALEGKLK